MSCQVNSCHVMSCHGVFAFGYGMPFWLLFIDNAVGREYHRPCGDCLCDENRIISYPFLSFPFILLLWMRLLSNHNVERPVILAYTVGSGTSLVPSVQHLEITLVARASSMEPANDRMVLDELLSSGRVLSYGDGFLVIQKVR
jgi:hypothetical protein